MVSYSLICEKVAERGGVMISRSLFLWPINLSVALDRNLKEGGKLD